MGELNLKNKRRGEENKYTKAYIFEKQYYIMAKLICDRCKKSVYKLVVVVENGEKERICELCYRIFNEEDMEVPKMIILRGKKLSLMGLYRDKTPRYMLSIPKDRNEDLSLNKKYDIWFKVRE